MPAVFKFKNDTRWLKALVIFAFAGAVYFYAPHSMPEAARRVMFVFVAAAFFWALEIIPLYATSLMVVLLETFLLCRPGGVLGMDAVGYKIFMLPFGSPVIMLFFGGFVMAAAMRKYHVDIWLASRLLRIFGTRPLFLMMGFVFITAFLSMWMSNTATTAVMIAMIIPLLRQLSADDPFRTGLVLSIPFAANIGGIGTPIGTPPNAIAMGLLTENGIAVTFLSWMKMAVPLAVILLILVSLLLYLMFRPRQKNIVFHVEKIEGKSRETIWTGVIMLITILFWLTSEIHKIPSALIALSAAGVFAAAGLLSRDDFKTVEWDVLILMWGGLALGEGMQVSGLTHWVVGQPVFDQSGIVLVVMFCVLAVVLSTFISNTAVANLIIPVVISLQTGNPVFMAVTVALSCSFAMALPISTPPNAIAYATQFLKTKDLLKAGIIVSLVSVLTVLAGYQWILPKVF